VTRNVTPSSSSNCWSAASHDARQRAPPRLLSAQGAAITGIQIDGVVHEFSSIRVREDVPTSC
jgi:hypothetical protein